MIVFRKKYIAIALVLLVLVAAFYIWWNNGNVGISEYSIISDKIPEEFNLFRIAQVSDLHNAEPGGNNKKLIEKLKTTDADIIVVTGDMIDSRHTKVDVAVSLAEEMIKIAPVYFVTGNHEARVLDEYEKIKSNLTRAGVIVMENTALDITKDNVAITLIGLHDTGFDLQTGIDYLLKDAMPDNDNYKILLAHRPEYFDKYTGVDLIFSGHAHGGQIRVPFIGGLFAPGQGILPKYDGGIYTDSGKTMVVSRGIGNSLFPVRVNNNPEIVVAELKKG